jgi:aspartyl protease family protein
MNNETAHWIWGVGALILVGSSLVARRMPINQWLKMLLAWVAIFAVAFVLFLFRDEGRAILARANVELAGDTGKTVGSTLRITKRDDGHFWVRANVNGKPIRFLIDSGATVTTLTPQSAASAGVEPQGAFPVLVETANGTVEARRAQIETLAIGPITQRNAAAQIGGADMGETNLLGMTFLSSLRSWRVEGNILILEL